MSEPYSLSPKTHGKPQIPGWLKKQLKNPPAEGTGLHKWIFKMGCLLAKHVARDGQVITAILAKACEGCRRDTSREIREAVHAVVLRNCDERRAPAWPQRDDACIARILKGGVNEEKLRAFSPSSFSGTSREILPILFPGDPLLCIGFHKDEFDTIPCSEWLRIVQLRRWPQFIVPSAMTARTGTTQTGRTSPKTNANTGPRQYLVIEFDFKPDERSEDARLLGFAKQFGLNTTRDICAALADHLAQIAPLALVIWSGGKSLHCWHPCAGVPEEKLKTLFTYACTLGADPATWTPSQFVRIPCGRNAKTMKRQEVLYFAPGLLPANAI